MNQPADRDLIARAQDGDTAAFEALVNDHVAQVRRFARAFASDDAEADDLAQDALIKVYRSIRTYRFQAAFSTWLFAVVRSVFLDARKGRAQRGRAIETPYESDVHGHAASEALGADVELERAEERQTLWRAIGDVPPEFRSTLVLFDIEGLSHDEIAAIEKIAVGTVKSRLSRGRDHLRRILSRLEPSHHTPPGNAQAVPVVSRSGV